MSDSSVLIEFAKRDILDRMFELDFQFAVPDILFHEELIDLGRYSRQDLLNLGLQVETLDPDGVVLSVSYQERRTALSVVDSFALALAYRHEWDLLTEDRVIRDVASSADITHHGALWIVDNMSDSGILSSAQLKTVMEAMEDDPRCPVSSRELHVRLRQMGK